MTDAITRLLEDVAGHCDRAASFHRTVDESWAERVLTVYANRAHQVTTLRQAHDAAARTSCLIVDTTYSHRATARTDAARRDWLAAQDAAAADAQAALERIGRPIGSTSPTTIAHRIRATLTPTA